MFIYHFPAHWLSQNRFAELSGRKEEEVVKYITAGKYIYTKVLCNGMNSIDPLERYAVYIQEERK